MPSLQSLLSNLSFKTISGAIRFYDRSGLPGISTARPFLFYRKVFFNNLSETEVFTQLEGRTVLDIGCGLTPFTKNSMFQACNRKGISFYGIDPKLNQGFKFDKADSLWSIVTGASSTPIPDMPSQEKALGAYADQLPFDDSSVDFVLSSWLLFMWIQDPDVLTSIFTEFDRVLKPGGRISFYPAMHWDKLTNDYPGLAPVLSSYQYEQQFFPFLRSGGLPFSYVLHLTKG